MPEATQCKAEIIEIIQETPRVKIFRIRPETPISFIPGQFLMLSLDGINNPNGTPLKRSYSIASKPSDSHIELCIAKMENGIISGKMHSMKTGEFVSIEGAYGNFKLKETDNDIILIAGGSGISPIISMIRSLFEGNAPNKIKLFFGVRNPNEIIYEEELEEYQESGNFEMVLGFSDYGEDGFIHNVIGQHEINPEKKDVYVCGPPLMVNAAREALIKKGFKKEEIMVDQW